MFSIQVPSETLYFSFMIFNVHNETENSIKGYLVPNSFAAEVRIRVTSAGRTLYEGGCHEVVDDLIRAGRHETGLTAFTLDQDLIPDLAQIPDLAVFDADTGMLIYRRNQPEIYLQARLFRLETTLAPLPSQGHSLLPHFAYGLTDMQLYGNETVAQLFNLHHYASMYFEGRVYMKSHQRFLGDTIMSAVSVRDPFVSLALTIDGLGQEDRGFIDQLEERELAVLLPLAGHLEGTALDNPNAVRKRLRSAPRDVIAGLESPLIALLTGNTPGQGGARSDLPLALDLLSLFTFILLDDDAGGGHQAMAEILELHPETLQVPATPAHVTALAEELRAVPALQAALENDLIAYHCLKEAHTATDA